MIGFLFLIMAAAILCIGLSLTGLCFIGVVRLFIYIKSLL